MAEIVLNVKKSKLGDIDDIFGIVLSDNRTKVNGVISFIKKTKTKTCWRGITYSGYGF